MVAQFYTLQRQLLYLPTAGYRARWKAGFRDVHGPAANRRRSGSPGLVPAGPSGSGHDPLPARQRRPHRLSRRPRPAFLERGFGVLLVEYRGFGGNPGQPSEAGLLSDAHAALAFLQAAGIGPEKTVLYGESLGSTVAVAIAADLADAGRPVAAMVLEAPLSSVRDVAAHHYPWVPVRWLLKDQFDATSRIATVGAPLMVVHGESDPVVPLRYGQALFEAARQPKEAVWVSGGGMRTSLDTGCSGSCWISSRDGCRSRSGEGLEGDDGERILDAGKRLDTLGHEMADIRGVIQITFQQQIVISDIE